MQPNESLQLRIRLPNALFEKYGKYLLLPDITFTYGKQEITDLLSQPKKAAISWRLVKDKKGWRLFATFDIEPAPCISLKNTGVIGLDINDKIE